MLKHWKITATRKDEAGNDVDASFTTAGGLADEAAVRKWVGEVSPHLTVVRVEPGE